MFFVHKIIRKKAQSEGGFVFLVALLGIFILIAIGFFALSTISEEMMISSKLVGARKAYSAAEAGVHAVCSNSNFVAVASTQVDPVNDPSVFYSATAPTQNTATPKVHLPGYSADYLSNAYLVDVVGRDTTYGSSMTIRIGLADEPTPGGLQQGRN
jgi:hypothetical protein